MGVFSILKSNNIIKNEDDNEEKKDGITVKTEDVSEKKEKRKKKAIKIDENSSESAISARILQINDEDPELANDLALKYDAERKNPASPFYKPYSQPTNLAVGYLQGQGIDTSELTEEWFNDPTNSAWLRSNLIIDGYSNTPKAPGKKATAEQVTAYQLYQYRRAMGDTKQAQDEMQKVIDDAAFWTNYEGRNMSNEQVKAKIREKFSTNYPMLNKMETSNTLVELNEAVPFSDEVIDAAIWMARNPEFKGNLRQAMAYSYLGDGNQWHEDPETAEKLNPESPKFQPYAVGSTNLDDAARHFNTYSFTQEWIDEHAHLAYDGTDEDKRYIKQIQSANQKTTEAEAAVNALNEWIEKNQGKWKDADDAKKKLDTLLARGEVSIGTGKNKTTVSLRILNEMDTTIGKNGEPGTCDLIPMTRSVDYKYDNVLADIVEKCEERETNDSGDGNKFVNKMDETIRVFSKTQDEAQVALDESGNADKKTPEEPEAKQEAPEEPVKEQPVPKAPEQDVAVQEAKDDALRTASDTIEEVGTPAEQVYAGKFWSVMADGVKNFWDTAKTNISNFTTAIATAVADTASSEYAADALPNFQTIYDYDTKKSELPLLQNEKAALEEKLGDKVYAGKTVGNESRMVTYEGKEYSVNLGYDEVTGYYIENATNAFGEQMDLGFLVGLQNSEEMQNIISEANTDAEKIATTKATTELTDEDEADLERYRSLELQIEDAEEYLKENAEGYETAQENWNQAQKRMDNAYYVLNAAGVDTFELEREELVLEYLTGFSNYEATSWSAYNPSDGYRIALAEGNDPDAVFQAAKEGNDKVQAELEEARAVKQYIEEHGLPVPDNYKSNLDRHIAKLERDIADYETFSLMQNADFKELAQKGRDEEYENRPQPWSLIRNPDLDWTEEEYYDHLANDLYDEQSVFQDYGLRGIAGALTNQMSEDEKDIYYYLMAKGEKQKAIEYVNSLTNMSYGVLHTRYTQELQEKTAEAVGDGAGGFIGTNILAILASPGASLASLGYMAYSAITGDEINPDNSMLWLNNFRSTTREQSAKEISDYYKDSPVGQQIVQGFYEMLTNRLDSVTNGAFFGALTGGISNAMLQEFLGASPMGMSAAMDAMSEAKRRGASDAQAWGIGAATFLAETTTEAISLSNIKEAFQAGKEFSADGIKAFLLNWVKEAGPSEAIGESINDIVEGLTDELIMGELSEHNDRVWSYRMKGYGKDEAEEMARLEEVKNVLHTAVISYLSPGMDIASYGAGKVNYYRQMTKARQKAGFSGSLIDVLKMDRQAMREAQEQEATPRESGSFDLEAADRYAEEQKLRTTGNANGEGALNLPASPARVEAERVAAEQTKQAQERQAREAEALMTDWSAIESAKGADDATKAATLASVLDDGGTDESSDMAKAAAARADDIGGSELVQDVMLGASVEGVDSRTVKEAVRNAILGGEKSAAFQVIRSDIFQNGTPDIQARMLANTTAADANNTEVQTAIAQTVRENRIAEAEKTLIADGALTPVNALQDAADEAAIDDYVAGEQLSDKQEALQAAKDNLTTVNNDFIAEPTDDNLKRLDQANSQLQAADAVVQEYDQHKQKTEAAKTKAEEALKDMREEVMTKIRQEATAIVDQQDQQRAEKQNAIDEEKQYKQALEDNGIIEKIEDDTEDLFASEEELEARRRAHFSYHNGIVHYLGDLNEGMEQTLTEAGFHKEDTFNFETGESGSVYVANRSEVDVDTLKRLNDSINAQQDERTGKTQEDADNAMIDSFVNSSGADEETKERVRQQLKERLSQRREGKIDLSKRLTDAESMLALGALQRKLGVPIVFSDEIGNADGLYSPKEGIIYLNARKANDGSMKLGQALVEVAMHEITHSLEQTKHYQKYRDIVLGTLFGKWDKFDQSAYDLAIKQKQDQYLKSGEKLTAEGAEKEIIADFAKKRLSEKDIVQRFMDAGMGGKMRNMLHNINQALKNFFGNMTGTDRETAENLRRAERAFQKALNEKAKTDVHPGSDQFSIAQFAQATNMSYDEKTQTLYDSLGRKVDGVNVKVTRDMIEKTPVGKLINLGLKDDVCYVKDGNGRNVLGEDGQPVIRYETDADGNQILDENGNPVPMTQKAAAAEMFTGLMNMIAQLKDQNLVWEIAGSTLESTFSALKANSDTQYHDTVDFGTICAKTQAIVNVMSEVMLDRLKANDIARKEGRFDDVSYGLTRDDVLKIYDETHKAGLSVPCPVCYVFSHWMGVPSLLGQMSRFQHDYIVTGKDSAGNDIHYGDGEIVMDENGYATFDPVETEKAAKAYIEKMHGLYGDKDGVDKRKTKINSEINKGEKRHTKLAADIEALENQLKNEDLKPRSREAAEKKLAAAKAEIEQNAVNISALDEELREVEAYNWITQSLMKTDENGEYVIDPDFQITPDEVLLDMRRTGEFSDRYGKNWAYRTSRGAGMGKSILPYSGASLGDIIMGKQTRVATESNPLFNGTDAEATKAVEGARDRAKRQNLIGGQRLQSTSDFRPEWGLDYIMAFLELQAANSNAQMYTKVAEAVDLFASAGADVNLSIMGSGNGFHEATAEELAKMTDAQREAATIDGKVYVMDFSDVTGMRYGDALEKSRQYDNVQMILVGMNDTHIRLALSGDEIDFVIPWHSSGNSREVLSQLVSSVEETLNTSSDYTNTQGDKFVSRKERYIDPETGKKKTRTVDNRTDEQKTMWNARIKILTGIAQKAVNTEDSSKGGLTEAEKKYVIGDKANPYLKDLYERFYLKEGDKCYGVALTSAQAKQIFPYEYWQTDVTKPGGTKETADENGRRFIEYCQAMGVVPRFSGVWDTKNKKVKNGNFAGAVYDSSGKITGYDTSKMQKGYWKLLIDRKMYDLNGNYREQKQIDVAGIQIGDVEGEGKQAHLTKYNPETGEGSMLPTETSAKYGIPALERSAAEASERQIRKPFDLSGTQKLYNDEFSEAELDDMLRQAGVDYQDAVAKGDMKAAQEDVDYYAEQRGFVTEEPAYHSTSFFGFTKFDMPKGSNMIFVSYDKHLAETYASNKNIREISSRSYDTMSGEYLANLASEIAMESGDDQQITFNRETGMFESRFVDDDGTESVEELSRQDVIDGVEGYREYVEEQQKEDPFDFTKESAALSKQGSGIYKFYTRPGNQFVIDGNNCLWNSIPVDIISEAVGRDVTDEFEGRKEVTTKQLGRWAMKNHYDSVRVNNIYDFGDASWYESKSRPAGDIAIFFNQEDVKSADPVTYDDQGKSIPLEERFGNDEDFRYSFGEQNNMTGAEMDDMLRQAGVLTQEDIDAYNERTSRPLEGKSTKWTQSEGPAQRQFGGDNGMLQESDEIAQQAVEYVRKNNAYFPDTNEAQIVRAVNWIRNNGSQKDENGNVTRVSDGFTESLQKVTGKSFDYRSADGQARMIATMAMAVAKNDVTAQVTLADAFNRQGTDLGRALQSRKLFKLMTPAGRIATLQKMMQNASDELGMKGIHKDLKFSDWIYRAASVAEDESDFRKVQAAAASELAEQLPISWKDRLQSLRMLSMLANPRTHIRNIIGNAMFVPAVSLKNKIGALMEVGVQKGEKTKTLAPFVSKEIRAFARQDAESIKDELTGEAKYNDQPSVKQAQKPLGNVGSFLSDLNSNALETEDWIFLKGHYRRALGGWMQANGYTAEQLQNDQSLLEKGREYAITEAKKATYRDFSATAQMLNEISRKGGALGFLVDAALPFKKTPINILRRGVEYSPLGVAKGLYNLAFKMNKTLTPTQVIDQICSGLSGTAVTALGFLLAGAGAVSCGLDDDEDKFEKLKGNQEYSIHFNLFGQDVTYTVDWAAPISMPFFVGAALREQTEADTKFKVNDVVKALGNIAEPVFNLSMLDGVNSLFRTSQFDDTDTLTQILTKVVTNYGSSFVPSIFGAVARTIDDTRRKAFVTKGENTGLEGTFRYAWEQAENKIPGVSQTNIPVRDVWGNPETTGFVERLIENFISPGYINNYKDDAVVNELSRLYQSHPTESSLIPKDADKAIEVSKDDTRNLGPEQWDTYQATRGQTAYRMLTDLMSSDDYQNATDETQIDMIKNVWSYATAAGKHAVFPDEIPLEEKSSESLARDGKITGWKRDMLKALEDGDTEGYEAMVTALQDEGIEDSVIKTKISDKYRDQYKKAYMGYLQNENDPDKASAYAEEMERIEILLDDSGFDFNIHGKGGWEQKTEEEYETKYGI